MAERRQRSGPGRSGTGESGPRRRGSGPTQARLLAVRALERVERVRAYANLTLHHLLGQSNLSSVDRALATELVYGTLRWRGRLDALLRTALNREIETLEPLVLTTLRLGTYQLFFSERIPASAAVDESVRLVRALGAERASGLVNAVLRKLAREGDRIELPALESAPLEHLVDALSLPRWIAERWLADYGAEEAAALARSCNEPPPLCVRANRRRSTRETLLESLRERFPQAHPCRFAPYGITLGRKGDAGRDPGFLQGLYTVQDEAAQLVIEMLDVRPGQHVLDTCAAPGTKTTAIAEALGVAIECERGGVLALDRNPQRLKLVARDARRLGLGGIRTLARDATAPLHDLIPASTAPAHSAHGAPETPTGFDRVLVDAPCSGLGTLRRNPDARWRVRPSDVTSLASAQAALLEHAAGVLKPGGCLVYSTCTVLHEENEDVVRKFLARREDFRLAAREELGAVLAEVTDANGFLRCFPHRDDSDGFFAARLVRESPGTRSSSTEGSP